jgi:hypothetical protein
MPGLVPFIQYKRPRGQEVDVSIERSDEVYAKAIEITRAGFRLECEELSTGDCSFTVADGERDYAMKVVPNGPEVPPAVDALILEFDIEEAKKLRDEQTEIKKSEREKLKAMQKAAREEAAKLQ